MTLCTVGVLEPHSGGLCGSFVSRDARNYESRDLKPHRGGNGFERGSRSPIGLRRRPTPRASFRILHDLGGGAAHCNDEIAVVLTYDVLQIEVFVSSTDDEPVSCTVDRIELLDRHHDRPVAINVVALTGEVDL